MKHKLILFLGLFLLFSAFILDKPVITIFMIGDSTMADKVLTGDNPERGWGQMLPDYLTQKIRVDNHAQNGRSSKSFIDEGRWEKVLSLMKKGDYVFIQFGHNDEKNDEKYYTNPGTTFDANLCRFVNEARAKGGIPVLFNSIVRRKFDKNAQLIDTHGAYLDAPRNVAQKMDVPFVDLNKITHELVETMGPDESKKLFMWVAPGIIPAMPKGREDDTHLNEYGGCVVAKLAIDAIVKVVPELAQYIRFIKEKEKHEIY